MSQGNLFKLLCEERTLEAPGWHFCFIHMHITYTYIEKEQRKVGKNPDGWYWSFRIWITSPQDKHHMFWEPIQLLNSDVHIIFWLHSNLTVSFQPFLKQVGCVLVPCSHQTSKAIEQAVICSLISSEEESWPLSKQELRAGSLFIWYNSISIAPEQAKCQMPEWTMKNTLFRRTFSQESRRQYSRCCPCCRQKHEGKPVGHL